MTAIMTRPKKKIEFKFNKQKAIETILYLAKKRPSIDKMSLYKFLFFADVEHLNRYGRPIIGDYYVAMQFGPVPSHVKNLLEKDNISRLAIDDYMLTATEKPDTDYLSVSDIEVLDEVYDRLKGYSARELSNLSHKHPAWINARNRNKYRNNNRLDYKDMIREENIELIEDLEENSKYIMI